MKSRMTSLRSTHMSHLRESGVFIFGKGFEAGWFPSKFDGRGDVQMLQTLVGANPSDGGTSYHLLPPILFPEGSTSSNDVFLNPALINVSFFNVATAQFTNYSQVLKVILFGRSSIKTGGRSTGPKPVALKWELHEITAGAIALAAIMVSPFNSVRYSRLMNTISRFGVCYHPTRISQRRAASRE